MKFKDPYRDLRTQGVLSSDPVIKVIEGTVRESFANYYDNPYVHSSHDVNFYIDLDPGYLTLHSPWNALEVVNGRIVQLMEMEWETNFFPPDFWPVIGDRVWVKGRHIWDCGHSPYHAEIHPPLIVAFTRFQPGVFGANYSGGADKPAHYSLGNVTYVYSNTENYSFQWRFSTSQKHEFDVPLPPKPAAAAVAGFEILGSSIGPTPELTWVNDSSGNHIALHFKYTVPANPSNRVMISTRVRSGWREPVSTIGFCRVNVSSTSLTVQNAHRTLTSVVADPTSPTVWNFWLQLGPQWSDISLPDVKEGVAVAGATAEIVVPQERLRLKDPNESVASSVPSDQPENEPLAIRNSGWKANSIDRQFGRALLLSLNSGVTGLVVSPFPGVGRAVLHETNVLDSIPPLGDTEGQNSLIGQIEKLYGPDPTDDLYKLDSGGVLTSHIPTTYPFLKEGSGLANPQTNADFNLRYVLDTPVCNPVVTEFFPRQAKPDDLMYIFGRNFDPIAANNIVSFGANGTARIDVQPTAASKTVLQITVPQGVSSGPLEVENPGGRTSTLANGAPYSNFEVRREPKINDFNPKQGSYYTEVTINGENLESADVQVGGYKLKKLLSVSPNELHALITLPNDVPGLATGDYDLAVTSDGGTTTAAIKFKFIDNLISIKPGASITVNSSAVGMGGPREITLAKAFAMVNGTDRGALSMRPDTDWSAEPYQRELIKYGEEQPGTLPGFNGKSGMFTNIGPGFANVITIQPNVGPIDVDSNLVLSSPSQSLLLNGNILHGKVGVLGITLNGERCLLSGPGEISGFDGAGVMIRGAEVRVLGHLNIRNNRGPGLLIDNVPLAYIGSWEDSLTDDSVDEVSGNTGAGVRIQGTNAMGDVVIVKSLGPTNQRGIEITGGAHAAMVSAGTVSGNTGHGVAVEGGLGGNWFYLYTVDSNGGDGINLTNSATNFIYLGQDSTMSSLSLKGLTNGHVGDNKGNGITIDGINSIFNSISGAATASGGAVVKNAGGGVRISGSASFNTIGPLWIMDNGKNLTDEHCGVFITGSGTNFNIVTGSEIGNTSTATVGPQSHGVLIAAGSQMNFVGGIDWKILPPVLPRDFRYAASGVTGNTLLNNTVAGVSLNGPDTRGNRIFGNRIGIDQTGSQQANTRGVVIYQARDNIIGGGNVIDGNASEGIHIEGDHDNPASGNIVANNQIGVDFGNLVGFRLVGVCQLNRIGGLGFQERNRITANSKYGIQMSQVRQGDPNAGVDVSLSNIVVNNLVGPDLSQATPQKGNGVGIRLENGTQSQIIGGRKAGSANVISGNTGSGIEIDGADSNYNQILGNRIGSDPSGRFLSMNGVAGIDVQKATGTRVEGNVIGGSGYLGTDGKKGVGILLQEVPRNPTTYIVGNLVGVDIAGIHQLANRTDGIRILNSQGVLVGGRRAEEGNVVSGNGANGIVVTGPNGGFSNILFNRVGVNIGGARMANGGDGILLTNGTQENQIGYDTPSGDMRSPNRVRYNGGKPIRDDGVNNRISGNITDSFIDGIVSSIGGLPTPPTITLSMAASGEITATVLAAGYPDGSVVEFFAADADAEDNYLGSLQVANSTASGFLLAPPSGKITATATTPNGATSGYSALVEVPAVPPSRFLWVDIASARLQDRNVSAGDQNVELLHIVTIARNQDVSLNEIRFTIAGSVSNAHLWEDINGNDQLDPGDRQINLEPTNVSGQLVFSGLSESITANTSRRWFVVADIPSTIATGQTIQLGIALPGDVVATASGTMAAVGVVIAAPVLGPKLTIAEPQ